MTGWLLDTNVISEVRRPQPAARVVDFLRGQPADSLFVSTVTFAEIRFGIGLVDDPGRRIALSDWLTHVVRPMFRDRILPVSEDIMFRWRLLVEAGRKVGHTFPQPDLIIAATALQHGLVVVTRDRTDFERAGATVFDPWTQRVPQN